MNLIESFAPFNDDLFLCQLYGISSVLSVYYDCPEPLRNPLI